MRLLCHPGCLLARLDISTKGLWLVGVVHKRSSIRTSTHRKASVTAKASTSVVRYLYSTFPNLLGKWAKNKKLLHHCFVLNLSLPTWEVSKWSSNWQQKSGSMGKKLEKCLNVVQADSRNQVSKWLGLISISITISQISAVMEVNLETSSA